MKLFRHWITRYRSNKKKRTCSTTLVNVLSNNARQSIGCCQFLSSRRTVDRSIDLRVWADRQRDLWTHLVMPLPYEHVASLFDEQRKCTCLFSVSITMITFHAYRSVWKNPSEHRLRNTVDTLRVSFDSFSSNTRSREIMWVSRDHWLWNDTSTDATRIQISAWFDEARHDDGLLLLVWRTIHAGTSNWWRGRSQHNRNQRS